VLPEPELTTLRPLNRAQVPNQSERASPYSDPAMSHFSAIQISRKASVYVMTQTMMVDILNRETVSACSSASKRGVPNSACYVAILRLASVAKEGLFREQ
jgi:hypothetical protein